MKGSPVVAEVAGEGGHVVGCVREAEHVVADEIVGGCRAEGAVVVGGGDDGELFKHIQLYVSCLYFLTSDVVQTKAVQIGKNTRHVGSV